ncbi:hypothetical protein BHU72_04100 [Desulfuribacillus stibiiarsenatis]|uniref:FecR protein domain-containing protein n=1 Tax=Desulfuribacillus stibiiarsenatis TaxID=1390249 RepID=A0A1E5L5A0_9FIRM|nr:FecR domain-containing protein [Desulfuribacillus stibiiarsenatis]OEH85286.1 hypothetical protein BHU72_04100 [Desulfuribacillus stibiiarsenatis]
MALIYPMKSFRKHMILFMAIVMFSSVLMPIGHVLANVTSGKMIEIKGDVQVLRGGGDKPIKAFLNMRLTEGDRIITGKGASAKVELENSIIVTLAENSRIYLSELRGVNNSQQTSISIQAGGVGSTVKNPLANNSRYEIKTPTAVMGVRGTEFFTQYNNGVIDVRVITGVVEVTAAVSSIPPTPPPPSAPSASQTPPPNTNTVSFVVQALQQVSFTERTTAQELQAPPQPLSLQGLEVAFLERIQELSQSQPQLIPQTLRETVQQVIQQTIEQKQQEEAARPPAPDEFTQAQSSTNSEIIAITPSTTGEPTLPTVPGQTQPSQPASSGGGGSSNNDDSSTPTQPPPVQSIHLTSKEYGPGAVFYDILSHPTSLSITDNRIYSSMGTITESLTVGSFLSDLNLPANAQWWKITNSSDITGTPTVNSITSLPGKSDSDTLQLHDFLFVLGTDGITLKGYYITLHYANDATIFSINDYSIAEYGSIGTISNVPYGTDRTTFLYNILLRSSYSSWDIDSVQDPVQSGDTIIVTSGDGTQTITYTIHTIFANPEISNAALWSDYQPYSDITNYNKPLTKDFSSNQSGAIVFELDSPVEVSSTPAAITLTFADLILNQVPDPYNENRWYIESLDDPNYYPETIASVAVSSGATLIITINENEILPSGRYLLRHSDGITGTSDVIQSSFTMQINHGTVNSFPYYMTSISDLFLESDITENTTTPQSIIIEFELSSSVTTDVTTKNIMLKLPYMQLDSTIGNWTFENSVGNPPSNVTISAIQAGNIDDTANAIITLTIAPGATLATDTYTLSGTDVILNTGGVLNHPPTVAIQIDDEPLYLVIFYMD